MADPGTIDALGTTLKWALIGCNVGDMTNTLAVNRLIILVRFELALDCCECLELLLFFSIGIADLQHCRVVVSFDDAIVE